jgi:6-pyruvoyltetrahydropterin/6-carboxytetrahydropterin synthase
MFDIAVEMEMAAAHRLRAYQGKCENLHGHNWKVRIEVSTPDLDEGGLGLDFTHLKNALKAILEEYDHKCLNDLPEFQAANPTSENLARNIYRKMGESLRIFPVKMKTVLVWESDRAFVRYYE